MRRRTGFSMLELMTSVALTTIVGLATFTLLTDVLAVHRRAESSADAQDGLRRVAERLSHDVRCAASVRGQTNGIQAGEVVWTQRDDVLVRQDADASVVMLRNVARFQADATFDGFVVTVETTGSRGDARGPAIAMRLRPRAEPAR